MENRNVGLYYQIIRGLIVTYYYMQKHRTGEQKLISGTELRKNYTESKRASAVDTLFRRILTI
jgi:hypothetical protein